MNKGRFLEDASEWTYNHMMKYKYSEYGDDYWFGILMMFFGVLILFFLCWLFWRITYDWLDKKSATLQNLTGKLIDKKYVGEENSSGTGTALVSTGSGVGVGVTSTSSHQDEQFLFFLDADKVYKCQVDMQIYYKSNIGDRIKFSVLIGGKSGDQLKIQLV